MLHTVYQTYSYNCGNFNLLKSTRCKLTVSNVMFSKWTNVTVCYSQIPDWHCGLFFYVHLRLFFPLFLIAFLSWGYWEWRQDLHIQMYQTWTQNRFHLVRTEQCDSFIFVTRASPIFVDSYCLKNQEQILKVPRLIPGMYKALHTQQRNSHR